MPDEAPRWRYRFDNFARALALLREAVAASSVRQLSALESEGLIQRFEYTWELAWKVMKDYLDAQGVVLAAVTPAAVIRAALAARIVADGDTWMAALDARNRMSHSYSLKVFEKTVVEVRGRYLPVLEALHRRLAAEAAGPA